MHADIEKALTRILDAIQDKAAEIATASIEAKYPNAYPQDTTLSRLESLLDEMDTLAKGLAMCRSKAKDIVLHEQNLLGHVDQSVKMLEAAGLLKATAKPDEGPVNAAQPIPDHEAFG